MIRLVDLLKMSGITLHRHKIHFAQYSNPGPFAEYCAGRFKESQEAQRSKNFECDMIVSLIHMHTDKWLFAGVYRVLESLGKIGKHYRYKTQLLPGQDDLVGRVIVQYKRSFRASYVHGVKYDQYLAVDEIKSQRITIEPFPGYNRVVLSNELLRIVIQQQDPSWKSALSSVKGVYLITDTNTGQMYVGSATGNDGIWQRWTNYADNGHGGNVELKGVLRKKGDQYVQHFQYTILEIADFHATDNDIIDREQHWKRALHTGEYGYNRN